MWLYWDVFVLDYMVAGRFVKFVTSLNVFDQKLLSLFFQLKSIHQTNFLLIFSGRVLTKDPPTIWLDEARPDSTCIPPFFW